MSGRDGKREGKHPPVWRKELPTGISFFVLYRTEEEEVGGGAMK